MNLTVKTRIAVSMSIVLLMSVATGGLSWFYHARAAEYAALSRAAFERSAWIETLSNQATTFFGEANDLALGLDAATTAESSAEYGDVMGVDNDISVFLSRPVEGFGEGELEKVTGEWGALRLAVFAWVNEHAAQGSLPTRLTLNPDGKVRASIDTNIPMPDEFEALDENEMRTTVRSKAEAFTLRTLRGLGVDASAEAQAAQRLELEARQRALTVMIVSFMLSAIVVLIAAVWLYRTIATPLNQVRNTAERVSSGDFELSFAYHGDDEIGALVHAIEEMRDAVIMRVKVMQEMAGVVTVTAESMRVAIDHAHEVAVADDNIVLVEALDEVGKRASVLKQLASQMLDS